METCLCMIELLCCPPETITTVLTGCNWQATVQRVAESDMTEQPRTHTCKRKNIFKRKRMGALKSGPACYPLYVPFLCTEPSPSWVLGKSPPRGGEWVGERRVVGPRKRALGEGVPAWGEGSGPRGFRPPDREPIVRWCRGGKHRLHRVLRTRCLLRTI